MLIACRAEIHRGSEGQDYHLTDIKLNCRQQLLLAINAINRKSKKQFVYSPQNILYSMPFAITIGESKLSLVWQLGLSISSKEDHRT